MSESPAAGQKEFERYLRTGRRAPQRLEYKFNPNHDPENGRFASGIGGGGGGYAAPGGARVPSATPQDGPFREAARQSGKIGKLAREVNAFAKGESDRVVIPLGGWGSSVTVMRRAGSRVTLGNFAFTADGELSILGDSKIKIGRINMRSTLAEVKSFPSEIIIFQSHDGNINYSIDRDLDAKIGRLFSETIKKGSYLFAKKGS